jgi:hypothetical protein
VIGRKPVGSGGLRDLLSVPLGTWLIYDRELTTPMSNNVRTRSQDESKGDQEMKKVLIEMGVTVMVVSIAFAQTKNQTAVPSASTTLEDVKRAIDKGNAQWSEGWAKGDAAMVAAIFADDGVQLAGSGKIIKGPQQIMERQKGIVNLKRISRILPLYVAECAFPSVTNGGHFPRSSVVV